MFSKLTYPLILASNSPRRKQILADAGFEFSTLVKNIDEVYPFEMLPQNVPEFLAHKKAKYYDIESIDNIIITSDTVVICNNILLEKPKSDIDAKQMLQTLSGKKHIVITAFCVLHKQKYLTFSDTAEVYFKNLSEQEINHYISTCKPLDKAGAYGIQDWIGIIGIEKINGSYYTVMGLPIHLVYKELTELFSA